MKIEYMIEKICDGCDEKKKTREVERLDPKRPTHKNYLCKNCDKSHHTISKILKWNKKFLPETHSIFGFPLEMVKDVSSIEMTIYLSK